MARGARLIAQLAPVSAERGRREAGSVRGTIAGMLGAAVGAQLVVSGNTGVGVASAEEAEAIAAALPKAEAIDR